jgi:hypothetical protein
MNNLATGYLASGKLDLALPLLEETFEHMKAKLGPDHPDTLLLSDNLVVAYIAARKKDLLFLDDYLKSRQKMAPYSWATFLTQSLVGEKKVLSQKRYPEAEAALMAGYDGMKQREKAIPQSCKAFIGEAVKNLVKLYEATDRKDETKKWAALVPENPKNPTLLSAEEISKQAFENLRKNAFADAEPLLRQLLEIGQKQASDSWATFFTQSLLGLSLVKQKKYQEAEPLLLAGLEGMQERAASIPASKRDVAIQQGMGPLADLYEATRTREESKLQGKLSAEKKQQTHEIKLTKGKAVVILMNSSQFDTLLELRDAKGKLLVMNDDINFAAKETNSRIWFMPVEDGVCRIVATSYQGQGRGGYNIVVREYGERKPKQ